MKKGNSLCLKFVKIIKKTQGSRLFHVDQFSLHTCLGHSNVDFVLYVLKLSLPILYLIRYFSQY